MEAIGQAAAPRVGNDEQALQPSSGHGGQADRLSPRSAIRTQTWAAASAVRHRVATACAG
jgi:hypothetical protein